MCVCVCVLLLVNFFIMLRLFSVLNCWYWYGAALLTCIASLIIKKGMRLPLEMTYNGAKYST